MMRLYIFFIFIPCIAFSQVSDSVELKEFEIVEFSSDPHVVRFDSTSMRMNKSQSTSELLSQSSFIFLKSYGPGLLSTSGSRGLGPAHTSVQWEGVELQSPMHGVFDLSLLPVSLFSDISFYNGPSNVSGGSGSGGGTIALYDRAAFKKKVSAEAYGSGSTLNDGFISASASFSTLKQANNFRLYKSSARNDFRYNNRALFNSPEQINRHNHSDGFGFIQNTYIQMSERSILSSHLWIQDNQRQIPPTMVIPISTQVQFDQSTKYLLKYKWQSPFYRVEASTALFYDLLMYHDSLLSLFDTSKAIVSANSFKVSRLFYRHEIIVGNNFSYQKGISDGYSASVYRKIYSLYSEVRSGWTRNISSRIGVKKELVDDIFIPLIPFARVDVKTKYIIFFGGYSGIYRIPTFNDLYWSRGGNKALLPEKGYNSEAGLSLGTSLIDISLNLFKGMINDRIIWVPKGSIWSPLNINSVKTQGVELKGNIKYQINSLKLFGIGGYSFTDAKVVSSKNTYEVTIGNQLIYVPYHQGFGGLDIQYRKLGSSIRYRYTGYRFTSFDNKDFLSAYNLFDISFMYSVQRGKVKIEPGVNVRNVFDQQYEVIEWRPMPGRVLELTLKIGFK